MGPAPNLVRTMSRMSKLAIGALAGGVFLLAAANPAAAAGDDVVVIGNSLLGQSEDELAPQLASNGWDAHIEHVNGSGLTAGATALVPYDWVTRLRQLEQQHDPSTVVIELGTNDAIPVNGGEPYPPHIDRLLAATDAGRIFWADCSQHTAVASRNNGCRLIQAALFDAKNRWGALEVLPYDDEVASDPRHSSSDSVHLSQWGQDALASLITRYVGTPK